MNRLIMCLFLLSACNPEDCKTAGNRAKERAALVRMQNPKCIYESGKYSGVAFCIDGRQLIICSEDDGCLYVNLDAEAESQ